jgi:2-dehydro-3-deoxygalactonokinase
VKAGRIERFATYMTGESFALYRNHSILGRLMQGEAHDAGAFRRGVELSLKDPAGLLHSLFSVRTLGLFNAVPAEALHSYLSGLLIGAEIGHATRHHSKAADYMVLGSPAIASAYITAANIAGLHMTQGDALCAIAGQRLIGHEAGLI